MIIITRFIQEFFWIRNVFDKSLEDKIELQGLAASWVDSSSRRIFPISFLIFNIVYWSFCLYHKYRTWCDYPWNFQFDRKLTGCWPEVTVKSPVKGIYYRNQKQEMRVFKKKNNLFIIYCFWKWLETNDRIKLNLGPVILDILVPVYLKSA